MNRKKAEIQHLAGLLNEARYDEIFGWGGSSATVPAKKEYNLGKCNIEVKNNEVLIDSSEEDFFTSIMQYIPKNIKITLPDNKLVDFVHNFRDDMKNDQIDDYVKKHIPFEMRQMDVKTKLIDDTLYFDTGFEDCFDFDCKLQLDPSQVDYIKKKINA